MEIVYVQLTGFIPVKNSSEGKYIVEYKRKILKRQSVYEERHQTAYTYKKPTDFCNYAKDLTSIISEHIGPSFGLFPELYDLTERALFDSDKWNCFFVCLLSYLYKIKGKSVSSLDKSNDTTSIAAMAIEKSLKTFLNYDMNTFPTLYNNRNQVSERHGRRTRRGDGTFAELSDKSAPLYAQYSCSSVDTCCSSSYGLTTIDEENAMKAYNDITDNAYPDCFHERHPIFQKMAYLQNIRPTGRQRSYGQTLEIGDF